MSRKKFDSRYKCVAKWKAHDQLILASALTNYNGREIFVTGGNDNCIAIWDVSDSVKGPQKESSSSNGLPFRPRVTTPETDFFLFRAAPGIARSICIISNRILQARVRRRLSTRRVMAEESVQAFWCYRRNAYDRK